MGEAEPPISSSSRMATLFATAGRGDGGSDGKGDFGGDAPRLFADQLVLAAGHSQYNNGDSDCSSSSSTLQW